MIDFSERPFAGMAIRLRFLREYKGRSKAEFAEFLGTSYNSYNNYESGNYLIPAHYALKIKREFSIPMDFLYNGDEDMLPPKILTAFRSKPRVTNSRKSTVKSD